VKLNGKHQHKPEAGVYHLLSQIELVCNKFQQRTIVSYYYYYLHYITLQ